MVYVKRWRTLVRLPAKYADEIVAALRIPDAAQAVRVPDGYILVPRELTAENGAKSALIGEFNEEFGCLDEDGVEQIANVPVTWTTIKAIHKKMVAHFEADPPVSRISAGKESDIADKLRACHQQRLALWEAIAGGPEPRCRDCADFDGRCQGDGLPCDPQERALERVKLLRAVPQSVVWRPIKTAPKDGTKVLLRFEGPFNDRTEDGITTGQFLSGGWWLSCIWASSTAHKEPAAWAPISSQVTRPEHS
jgi:hypothetical protein